MNVLATVMQSLILVFYFDIAPLIPPFLPSTFIFHYLGSGLCKVKIKISVWASAAVTSADVATWLDCSGAVVSVEGHACS